MQNDDLLEKNTEETNGNFPIIERLERLEKLAITQAKEIEMLQKVIKRQGDINLELSELIEHQQKQIIAINDVSPQIVQVLSNQSQNLDKLNKHHNLTTNAISQLANMVENLMKANEKNV